MDSRRCGWKTGPPGGPACLSGALAAPEPQALPDIFLPVCNLRFALRVSIAFIPCSGWGRSPLLCLPGKVMGLNIKNAETRARELRAVAERCARLMGPGPSAVEHGGMLYDEQGLPT